MLLFYSILHQSSRIAALKKTSGFPFSTIHQVMKQPVSASGCPAKAEQRYKKAKQPDSVHFTMVAQHPAKNVFLLQVIDEISLNLKNRHVWKIL